MNHPVVPFLSHLCLKHSLHDLSETIHIKQWMRFILLFGEHLLDFFVAFFVRKVVALSGTQLLVTAHYVSLVMDRDR